MSAPADLSGKLGVYRARVWSTSVDLIVTDHRRVIAAAEELHGILSQVERVASRFLPDSEVSRLQRSASAEEPVRVSPELLELVQVALRSARLSDGAVDPTVGNAMCRIGYDRDFSSVRSGVEGDLPEPGPVVGWRSVSVDTERATITMPEGTSLDLGATAKAWAADHAAYSIASHLDCGVLVSIGGDVAIGGEAPPGGFAVGIADVCSDQRSSLTVAIASGGIATSGTGNRHWRIGSHQVHHLLDPATGLPVVSPWTTVSVAAGNCVDANTASTAAMIIGGRASRWLDEQRLPSRLVRSDGTTVVVAGWPTVLEQPRRASPTLRELVSR
jgi:thiamine biosynthesis lipoprotein ApbE